MICVQCHLHQYFTWIKEGVDHAWKGWIAKHLDWGPNPSAPYASTRSPCYLWYKEPRRPSLIQFGKVDSDSRNSPHQNHHRDHIWTPFWTCQEDNLSNGSGLMSEHHPIPCETSKQWSIHNLLGCCLAIFWPDGLCIELSPIGAHPRVGAQPELPFGHPRPSHILS
jgi:hypothetical protein